MLNYLPLIYVLLAHSAAALFAVAMQSSRSIYVYD